MGVAWLGRLTCVCQGTLQVFLLRHVAVEQAMCAHGVHIHMCVGAMFPLLLAGLESEHDTCWHVVLFCFQIRHNLATQCKYRRT